MYTLGLTLLFDAPWRWLVWWCTRLPRHRRNTNVFGHHTVSLPDAHCIAPEAILLFFAEIDLARNHVARITDLGDLGPSDWPPEYAQKLPS